MSDALPEVWATIALGDLFDFKYGKDLPQEKRIGGKLERLLGKVDACQRRLAKIPRLFKRFRQSVLAAACSGRLTADWREQASPADLVPPDPANANEAIVVEEIIDAAES